MNHLTDEQFEDVIKGIDVVPSHLEQCPDCSDRLAEKRALVARLNSAFASIRPDANLAARISDRLDLAANSSGHGESVGIIAKLWPVLATAAAIMIVAVPISLYFVTPSTANAAQEELASIHKHNIKQVNEFYAEADPEKLAGYFKEKLGFSPALPCVGKGMEMLGCCVAHFKGRVVGSYVVDTPKGAISVIVVTDTPKTIGMNRMVGKPGDQQTFWKGSFARCKMVTVRLGDYSYCAVGEISHNELKDLLSRLLPDS